MSQHKKIPLLAALVLALLGLLFAGYWYLHGRYFESTDNAYLQSQGEIVNILLKIKNSFLPTKQILIGL